MVIYILKKKIFSDIALFDTRNIIYVCKFSGIVIIIIINSLKYSNYDSKKWKRMY